MEQHDDGVLEGYEILDVVKAAKWASDIIKSELFAALDCSGEPSRRKALADMEEEAGWAWEAEEIGDGNLNLVFVLRRRCRAASPATMAGATEPCLVLKQALPYVRCVGEGWPLSAERAGFEWAGLREQQRLVPDRVPTPLYYDQRLRAILMSHLSPHIILRYGVVDGRRYEQASQHLSDYLARTLYLTSVYKVKTALEEEEWHHKVNFFNQNHMSHITEELFFVEPFTNAARNRWNSPHLDSFALELRNDEQLRSSASTLRTRFLHEKEALLHGDLHTGSVMVSNDDTKIIDPEFAWFGPIGFDVGLLIGNLLLGYFSQSGHASAQGESREEYKEWMLGLIDRIWTQFADRFALLWKQDRGSSDHEIHRVEEIIGKVWDDTLGYAGCAIIRRIVGLAHALELESIVEPGARALCERRALKLGRELMARRGTAFSSIQAVCEGARTLDNTLPASRTL